MFVLEGLTVRPETDRERRVREAHNRVRRYFDRLNRAGTPINPWGAVFFSPRSRAAFRMIREIPVGDGWFV